jgi:hypothetical protein
MSAALDTNVVLALWNEEPSISQAARQAIDSALQSGKLVISGCVFAELMAYPGRDTFFLGEFVGQTGIIVEWDMEEGIWRAAGLAYQAYVTRRRRHAEPGPRRILTDFLIGAHAQERGYALLTLDDRLFRTSFPKLRVLTF